MTFEFDLASLEAHDEDIRLAERNRIIKLLEDPATLQGWFTTYENYQGKTMLSYLIALIKGEN